MKIRVKKKKGKFLARKKKTKTVKGKTKKGDEEGTGGDGDAAKYVVVSEKKTVNWTQKSNCPKIRRKLELHFYCSCWKTPYDDSVTVVIRRLIRHLSNTSEEELATLRETMWTVLEAVTKLKGTRLIAKKCVFGQPKAQSF